jgi:hypothetical protein
VAIAVVEEEKVAAVVAACRLRRWTWTWTWSRPTCRERCVSPHRTDLSEMVLGLALLVRAASGADDVDGAVITPAPLSVPGPFVTLSQQVPEAVFKQMADVTLKDSWKQRTAGMQELEKKLEEHKLVRCACALSPLLSSRLFSSLLWCR